MLPGGTAACRVYVRNSELPPWRSAKSISRDTGLQKHGWTWDLCTSPALFGDRTPDCALISHNEDTKGVLKPSSISTAAERSFSLPQQRQKVLTQTHDKAWWPLNEARDGTSTTCKWQAAAWFERHTLTRHYPLMAKLSPYDIPSLDRTHFSVFIPCICCRVNPRLSASLFGTVTIHTSTALVSTTLSAQRHPVNKTTQPTATAHHSPAELRHCFSPALM